MIAFLLAACCLPAGPASTPPAPPAPAASTPPEPAPAEPAPASDAPLAITARAPQWPAGPRLLVTIAEADGCVWKVASPSGTVELARSAECPGAVVWSRELLLAKVGEATLSVPWSGGGATPVPEIPGADCLVPYPAATGKLRRVCSLPAGEGWMLDGKPVPVGSVEGWTAYGLDGMNVVPPRGDDADIHLVPWGLDAFAALYELDGGAWKRLAALPTRTDAGDTPGTSVLDPFLDEAKGFVSTPELQACCACGQDCAIDDPGTEPAAVGLKSPESVGSLPVGTGAVWFEVVFGDTPHAQAPVTYCHDAGCAQRVAWATVGDLVGIAPRGDLVLVGTEYSGAGAKVFRANVEAPVLDFPGATLAVWLPDDALPPVP
ncbi:MAG: hypothetical protein H6737_09510 [Alphaproteobacteria bacterium]|nr:hypothetical protein [Alphaproteobacteria bacterium]